ncbi:MAG: hypothetical protein IRY91_04280 [Gemmatimonadaceae bacterium]|nr:hypothetical protein [Gemmatimonadaceae bacterium]
MPEPHDASHIVVEHDVARDPASVLAWAVVAIPAAWGIYHVVVDALKLFRP